MILDILTGALFLTGLVLLYFEKLRVYSLYLFGLGFLCLNPGRTNYFVYLLPSLVMAYAVVITYAMTKKNYIWMYLIVPAITAGYLWHLYSNYAGVVNPRGTVFFSALALIVAMFSTVKLKTVIWRGTVNVALIAVVLASVLLCSTPNYTYAEAERLISNEVGISVTAPTDESPYYFAFSIVPIDTTANTWSIFPDCIDHFYVFQTIDDGTLTIYDFNTRRDTWAEVHSQQLD